MSSYWAFGLTLIVVGLALGVWATPISAWNRRVSAKWGREVREGSFVWSARYMRIVGYGFAVVGVGAIVIGAVQA